MTPTKQTKAKLKKIGIPTEQAEQKWVIQWSQQPSVREAYPELALLYHIPNERADKVQAAIMKAMGVKSGVPDLHLPVPAGSYHGLYIEMKALDGKVDEIQSWWHQRLSDLGNCVRVCYGWKEAVEVLKWYLSKKK